MYDLQFVSYKKMFDSFCCDEGSECLRWKNADGSVGDVVKPAMHDVRGRGLVEIGNAKVPVEIVVAEMKRADPEEVRRYPDKEWAYDNEDWNIPTQARMRELFDYDPHLGVLIHKLSGHRIKAGTIAGSRPRNPDTPMSITIDGYRTMAHRAVYLWHTGRYPYGKVRHCDENKTNNRIENLYVVSG
jgi:hypothetical protein